MGRIHTDLNLVKKYEKCCCYLTIQWLLVGHPESISGYRDIIFDMVMKAIEKRKDEDWLEVRVKGIPSVVNPRADGG